MSLPVRTILAAIVLAALIVTGVAIVVPLIARPMIVAAVQSASPFGDQHLDIDVDCNVFGLLRGKVDRIHVHGTDLRRGSTFPGSVTIGALDLTLTDVATSGHSFGNATGTLAALDVPLDDGSTVTIDQVTLAGPSDKLGAVGTLGQRAATRLIESAFAEGGVDVTGVELGSGTIAFEIFGARAEVPIGVTSGSVVVVDPFGQGDFELITPGQNDGWRFTGAGVTPNGMTVEANLDVEKLLSAS